MFPELTRNLLEKDARVAVAEARLRDLRASERDPLSSLSQQNVEEGFVAFCGAGISIPAPSAAPGFLDLRNALIRALAELLRRRSVLSPPQHRIIASSLDSLGRREDISLPPEMMFSSVKETMGAATVTSLLAACLNVNRPNDNHMALAKLARNRRLLGIITPNFDTYIESAFANLPLKRHIVGVAPGRTQESFFLMKPHGSLDMPTSIVTTLESVILRPRDDVIDEFRRMLENRTLLVVGYSGADYDLHPLLVYAGRNWNSRIIWVLWDKGAMNENVARLQLALGDRCTIIDGHRRAVLAELAGLPPSIREEPYSPPELESRFCEIMEDHRTITLVSAFHQAVNAYLGVSPAVQRALPDIGLSEYLLQALLVEAKDTTVPDTERFDALMKIARSSERAELRNAAVRYGRAIAAETGQTSRVRLLEHYGRGLDLSEAPDDELTALKFELEEGFPEIREIPNEDPERVRRSLRIGSELRKAELLLKIGAIEEADLVSSRLLRNEALPEHALSKDACLMEDGKIEGQLRRVIAEIYMKRGDAQRAAKELSRALDVFWRELDLFELEFTLYKVVKLTRQADPDCAKLALTLQTRVPRLTGDRYTELQNLVNKIRMGFEDPVDEERAESLLGELDIDHEEKEQLETRLRRALNSPLQLSPPAP